MTIPLTAPPTPKPLAGSTASMPLMPVLVLLLGLGVAAGAARWKHNDVNAEKQVAEITAAAAGRDTAALAGVAHTLKSAARSVGALRLGELCQSLETAARAGDGQQCSALAAGLAGEFAAAATAINGHLGL